MNCAPDCRARLSSAVTRSPAGMLTRRTASACAWAASESEQAKASKVVRNERIMVTLSPGWRRALAPLTSVTNVPCKSRLSLLSCAQRSRAAGEMYGSLATLQHDRVLAAHGAHRKPELQQSHELIGIGPAEIAADPQGADRGVADDDLADVVAIEFRDGRGQRRVVERDETAAPVQQFLRLLHRIRTPHHALGHDDAQIGRVAAHVVARADGDRAAVAGADHERATGILGDLEECLALLQVDVTFVARKRDQDAAVAAQRDYRPVGQRDILQAADGGAIRGLPATAL